MDAPRRHPARALLAVTILYAITRPAVVARARTLDRLISERHDHDPYRKQV